MPQVRRALRDIIAGAIFIVFGGAFATGSLAYEIGTPFRMGPGYLPLVLGVILVALGILIIAKGFIAGSGDPIGIADLRVILLITAALLFFGITVRGLGLVGALLGSSLLAALARSQTPIRETLLFAVGITALSVVVFIFALQLRLPLLGNWIPL